MDLLHAASAPTPLIYEAFAGGWPAALVVLGVLLVGSILWAMGDAGLFVALATINDRRRRNGDLRRRARYADRVVAAARAGGLFDQDGGR